MRSRADDITSLGKGGMSLRGEKFEWVHEFLKISDGFNGGLEDVKACAKKESTGNVGDDKGSGNNNETNDGVGDFFHGFTSFIAITSTGDVVETG